VENITRIASQQLTLQFNHSMPEKVLNTPAPILP